MPRASLAPGERRSPPIGDASLQQPVPDRHAPCSATGARCQRGSQQERTALKYILRLYVTGRTVRAEEAIANLRRICEAELTGQYELQIIDVLEQPQLAEDEKILATPTLIKQLPPPLRRVIGDLSDKEKVLLGLEVRRARTSNP